MRNQVLRALRSVVGAIAIGVPLFAQPVPDITYDANADFLTLPSGTYLGEVAGVASNSRGHVFVYTRTGHAVATLGNERTFYHGGSRLFQFDQTGKFVKEIGQGPPQAICTSGGATQYLFSSNSNDAESMDNGEIENLRVLLRRNSVTAYSFSRF